jgi:hypothetical protein
MNNEDMLADPIMDEVRKIKADIVTRYPTREAYNAHLDYMIIFE